MISDHPTSGAALRQAAQILAAASPTPDLDAAVLLGHILGLARAALLAQYDRRLTAAEWQEFSRLVSRRAELVPVAYLIGEREFFGLPFWVDERVLVPRPDTEILVERALSWIGGRAGELVVADVGTGSGCIAVALAVAAPRCRIYALDISAGALEVARQNVVRHHVGPRVSLLASDLLAGLPEPADLVVSNPPYTLLDEIDEGVRRHEPHLALDGGPDGLDVYRRLIPAALAALRPRRPGAVLLEIGAWQGAEVVGLARTAAPRAAVELHQDLAGRDRVVEILVRGGSG
jgi:release factor glutamine methyltransferase